MQLQEQGNAVDESVGPVEHSRARYRFLESNGNGRRAIGLIAGKPVEIEEHVMTDRRLPRREHVFVGERLQNPIDPPFQTGA